jgi:AAHS family 4-hydroxybenzoate transporter-like MFS transporter
MSCQVAVGALLGGLFAPILIARGGWPAIFLVGGLLPVVLCVVMAAALPESPALLAVQSGRASSLARLIRRVAPLVDAASVVADPRPVETPGSLVALIRAPYLPRTMAFWVTFTIGSFLVYLLTSWLPVLLGSAGWSRDAAVRGITLLQGGGIAGGLVVARFIDRRQTIPALCVVYGVAGCAGIGFGLTPSSGAAWPVLLCLLGAAVLGGMLGVMAVGALLYPPQLRAAGLGTGAAVARVGAVLGPLVGGAVLALGIAPATILAWLALPAGVIALSIGVLRRFLVPDASNALPPA